VYVLREIKAWDERRAVGSPTWKRLARWAVKWVSDWRCAGSEGSEDWAWAGALPVVLPAMMEEAIDLSAVRPIR